MALQRWDPFAEMRRFNSYFDGHFNRRGHGFPVTGHHAIKNSWYIPLDAVEEGDDLLVRVCQLRRIRSGLRAFECVKSASDLLSRGYHCNASMFARFGFR